MASGRATICSMDLSTVLSRSRPQQSQPAKPAPRSRSSPEPHAGQTIRPGLDVARDETLTLASFVSRGLLLIEPTILLRRNGGVTGSVTGGEIRQREPPRARAREARTSFVIAFCGRRPLARAAVAGPRGNLEARPRLQSLRRASLRYWLPGRRRRGLLRVVRAARATSLSPPKCARAHPAGRSPAPGCLLLAS